MEVPTESTSTNAIELACIKQMAFPVMVRHQSLKLGRGQGLYLSSVVHNLGNALVVAEMAEFFMVRVKNLFITLINRFFTAHVGKLRTTKPS